MNQAKLNDAKKIYEPLYRLYRLMDGEVVLQRFIPDEGSNIDGFDFLGLSALGEWTTIPTINEDSNGQKRKD